MKFTSLNSFAFYDEVSCINKHIMVLFIVFFYWQDWVTEVIEISEIASNGMVVYEKENGENSSK